MARTCYDHLAGRLAVALTDALTTRNEIVLSEDGGVVTAAGEGFLAKIGIDPRTINHGRRAFCRPCLDWSERRPHLAGALGAALAARFFQLGWITRVRDTRAVQVSDHGRAGFETNFGLQIGARPHC
jgi:hypothetical protein